MRYTSQHVKNFAAANPLAYVVLYAKWCGFSKDLIKELGLPDPNITLPRSDQFPGVLLIEEKEMDKKIAPRGYPTVRKYVNGKLQRDTKGTQRQELINYVHGLGHPSQWAAGEGEEGGEMSESEGEMSEQEGGEGKLEMLLGTLMQQDLLIKELIRRNQELEEQVANFY